MQHHDTDRRGFLRSLALGGFAATVLPHIPTGFLRAEDPPAPPKTNIADALAIPRTAQSMPGLYPGRVVDVYDDACVANGTPDNARAMKMLERAMLELTGAASLKEAWLRFVTPEDYIGLKVNPVAGKLLSTSHAITLAVIAQLEQAGIPRDRIVIWDRREFELHETGFTRDVYPGIRIWGAECKDNAGSFYDERNMLYSLDRIDESLYYWADCEESYDEETLPYMINEGKYSYFHSLLTEELTKVINIPILKNAGSSVTLCLKNLAYGAISNTARLHKQLWAETCAQVPCFEPLRDKTVLNIVDGMIGCYNGGPAANPQFITEYKRILVGTDPVATDRVGYDIVLAKRIAEGVQKQESPRAIGFMTMAESYKLGIADPSRITHVKTTLKG
jgi:hypothetical protein